MVAGVMAALIAAIVFNSRNVSAQTVSETIQYPFCSQTNCADGAKPEAGLIKGSDGSFYGTTMIGGSASNFGTVFKITPSGTLSTLYSFGSQTNDGAFPAAGLLQGSDGNFYGTTFEGGLPDEGTVFKITPSGALTTLYSFGTQTNDGAFPEAALVEGSDGNFYGTALDGGAKNNGTIFRITPSGIFTLLYSFGSQPNDGANPAGALLQASDGDFYGTTTVGGANHIGTVFKMTPAGVLNTLYSFGTQTNDGNSPNGSLIEGSDGNFYGTTFSGGANGKGTVFNITPSGQLSMLHSFDSDGAFPEAGLIAGSDGKFYGTTNGGGSNQLGTVFEVWPIGVVISLYSFGSQTNDGSNPISGLLEASDGDFYGTTSRGGANRNGIIFELSISSPSPTATATSTATTTASATPTVTRTASASPTPTATLAPSATRTSTPTATATIAMTPTSTITVTATATPTAPRTSTPTQTQTATATGTPTVTITSTPTASATATQTQTRTATATGTPTATITSTPTTSATATPTQTRTATATGTPTASITSTPTASATATPTQTRTATATGTPTATITSTPTTSATATPTQTSTAAPTITVTVTSIATATVTRTATASSTPTETMTATPIATPVNTRLLAAPLRLNFRNVLVADAGEMSAPLTIRLVGRGKAPVMFAHNSATMVGANPTDFQIVPGSNTCSGSALNCSIKITFQPTGLGSRTAVLRFDDDASNSPQMVRLSGNGIPVKLIIPKAVAFGMVSAGSTISKEVTLTNDSDVSVTVTNVAPSNPENFPLEQNECATIAPHSSCQLSVGFHPTMIGPMPPAKLEITDDAAQSPQIVRLIGTGSH